MVKNEGDRLKKVIVCTPQKEYFHVKNLHAQNIHEIAEKDQTIKQHDQLKNILSNFGCQVVDVPELANHPNSVFTRDVSLTTPEGYIKLRMGLEARGGEETWMASHLKKSNIPCVGEIYSPGFIEGGDIILAGKVAFVGISSRTNENGLKQLSDILKKMDYEIRTTPISDDYLHIGGAMSAIGPDKILCCADVFPDGFFEGFETIEVPHQNFKPSVGNVICLQENEVIANAAENMETIKILESNGVTVHHLDLSEFRKGAGGPTCLILPVEREN